MTPIDYKKIEKQLYGVSTKLSIVAVPEMSFITVSGKRDPSGSVFQTATEILYSLSYAIKMANKATLEYVMPPLEGLWWARYGTRGDKSNIIRYILENFDGITPENAVMVGDRKYDIIAAKANDMRSIGVLYGFGDAPELSEAGADWLAKNADEIYDLISAN